MMKTAIFSGTFDPITHGHMDIIERGSQLFDNMIVAVAANPGKKPLLSLDDRVHLVKSITQHLPQVSVMGFDGLLVDFAKAQKAHVIIRSLRSSADFEHEAQLAFMNQEMDNTIQTVLLMPSPAHVFISSTLVREIASLRGDISRFVSPIVEKTLKKIWP